jgi:long-chain acyl-CoA synthetase
MRIERNGLKEQYTYQDLQELATRAAAFLAVRGIGQGQRVMLLSHNAPEWGMAYFGVMKAGATCIPLDPDLRAEDIVKFAGAGEASGIILSQEMSEKHDELAQRLADAGLEVKLWLFEEVFAMPDEATEAANVALIPKKKPSANSVASLIFTSGTTGQPKAVMLTHKNFTSMTSMLTSVVEMDTGDGALSVLPLHHTFEFSAGFLAPLSRGAQITYLEELNGESLNKAINNGHVTGLVGVPALWELLHRRIKNRFNEQGKWFGELMDGLIAANSWLRNNTPFNLGQVLFFPIHQGMGGRIRYFISGGSALNDKIQKDFHGMGFTILEGYGLTEASPVLTFTRPRNELLMGSVGASLPGVEVKILEPHPVTGVGEVIARGPNVMLGYYNNEAATKAALQDRWLYTGDLGRLDEDGNLYLVGRSKDIIVDTNGKNVYPDEIEELYATSPFIEELSVVGLPDGVGEKVACLARPNYDHDIALSSAETRRKVEEHFRDISSTLPFFKRVKVLHFTDDELPRTATKKVKRREIVALLEQLEQDVKDAAREAVPDSKTRDTAWLLDIVAQVSNRSRAEVSLNSRLAELGFDSLMFVELASAIENAGGVIATPNMLNEVHDVRELASLVTRGKTARARRDAEQKRLAEESRQDSEEIYIPSFVREIGGRGLDFAQRFFYESVLDSSFEGQTNIPPHCNFIVAPNHTSHLDTGLTRMALGDAGQELVALAAADYFFDNKYKRAYMNNFTNVVPLERSGSLRQSLRHARSFLENGYNALIFPEGTRSLTGEMADFKPILGYLALSCRTGILPMYLWGTYEAYPKGATLLKARKIGARIGRFLEIEELEAMTKGLTKADAYRLIAARVEHEVRALRDGTRTPFDADALKKQFRQEKRGAKAQVIDSGKG